MTPLEIYQNNLDAGSISPDLGQLEAVGKLDFLHQELASPAPTRKWYQRLSSPERPGVRGCYLWGSVGTGKTMLMDTFFQAQPDSRAHRIHFHRFMQAVHDEKNRIRDHQDPLDIIAGNYASKFRVLCLDEFSVTDITDAMILSGLLNHLFRRGLVLVTTSNSRIEDLYKDGLQRTRFLPAIELLQTHTNEIQVDSGSDYRMAYLKDDAIFHTPLGEESSRALANCFRQLSGKDAYDGKTIVISGREIDTAGHGSGAAWFTFGSLCESSRSSLDYIEIAREFHTVILSDIPRLDSTADDAARRFIQLVDIFYDRNVNLIASSACAPAEIYSGVRLAEPFRRTASRLNEMSTDDYLSRPHLS
jgi:cell division protein ZapE